VVERFFAWINRNRRLAKDVEATIASAEAFLYAASAILLYQRPEILTLPNPRRHGRRRPTIHAFLQAATAKGANPQPSPRMTRRVIVKGVWYYCEGWHVDEPIRDRLLEPAT
jgi:hypothetical protein